MNNRVQIITSPKGERLVVMPEDDYLILLSAAEEDEELDPASEAELDRRRAEPRETFVPLPPKTARRSG